LAQNLSMDPAIDSATPPGLTILWRGPLASCNYACGYCPFAKRKDSRIALAQDRAQLERFVAWVAARDRPVSILFTPWGEALIRRHYRMAMTRLSHMPQVRRVAAQTNLSFPLGWLAACNRERLALWCTYHPGEVARDRFLARCRDLDARGVRYSVGIVGLKEHFDEIEAVRRDLDRQARDRQVYLWINAYKRQPGYYAPADIDRLAAVDPLFELNNQVWNSEGRGCRAGHTAITVDGDGTARRCHFIKDPIGNIYAPDFDDALKPRACTGSVCRCHIGYVHMEDLDLYDLFGRGVLERIPGGAVMRDDARLRIAAFGAGFCP
jgi:MoaA/NifB/PqqE/SkfB family radical SAM enzyme